MMMRPMGATMSTVNVATEAGRYSDRIFQNYKVKNYLTRDVQAQWEELGEARVRKLIRYVNEVGHYEDTRLSQANGHGHNGRLMHEKENYRIYELIDEKEQLLIMKGVLMLQSSNCDEVMELLSGSNTADVRAFLMDLFGSYYADSVVLHHADLSFTTQHQANLANKNRSRSTASAMASSMACHWLALKDQNPQLPVRDFVLLRYNQTFASDDPTSSSKSAYGASVWESLDLPICQPLFGPKTMVRNSFKNCGFVCESADDSDATRVTFFVTAPLNLDSLQIDRNWLLRMAGSVRFLPTALVNMRIRHNNLLDKKKWESSNTCALCTSTFNLFRRQHHCRICGTSVCSKCSSVRKDTRGNSSTATNGARVCMSCLNGEDTSALWSASVTRSVTDDHSSSRGSSASKDSWTSRDMASSRASDGCAPSSRNTTASEYTYRDTGGSDMTSITLNSSVSYSITTNGSIDDEDDVVENTHYEYELTYKKGNAWPDAPMPHNEQERIKRIQTLSLSQQYAEANLKELLDFARTSVNCPVAAVSVVMASTSLLVTANGLAGDQLPRDIALESHGIMSTEPLVFLDMQSDERTARSPIVQQLKIQFYVAIPLVTKEGIVVGCLSLGDLTPRDKINGSDIRSLKRIAARLMDKMDASNLAHSELSLSGMRLI